MGRAGDQADGTGWLRGLSEVLRGARHTAGVQGILSGLSGFKEEAEAGGGGVGVQ